MAGAIKKYLSLQVPRYTSYPTAPHFSAAIDAGRYRTWLEALDPAQKLSLYLHIPFCRRLCWYCGCNMRLVARYDPIAAYVQTLIREIELLARSLPEAMSVAHVHWGGGTPNCLSEDDFLRVNEALRRHFNLQAEAEIAVELDPRILTANRARALSRIGCTRASLGVQELDPKVQAAINRIQPLSTIEKPVELLRGHSIGKFNFDLMYGLPHQTSQTLKCTIHELARLEPDRVALFGYAHVPWAAKNQRLIANEALPTPYMRFQQFQAASESLVGLGYEPIGLDHFAKPSDRLAMAARSGHLRRNFQGYTDDRAGSLIGFGASAISALSQGYVQNLVETGAYTRAVNEGKLPVAKGLAFKGEDRLRGALIERLMCNLEADLDQAFAPLAASPRFGREISELQSLAEDKLVELNGLHIRVTEAGRPFLRVICATFDAYLDRSRALRHAIAV